MSNADKIISLNITKFPQNLLIPGIKNEISIQALNYSSKKESFKFDFEGENLKIDVEPENFKSNIEFGPGESKTINLRLEPTNDGYGKLTINAYWLKIAEYTVQVQKVRDSVQTSKVKKILDKQRLKITEVAEKFNPKDFIIDMNEKVIKQAEKQLASLTEQYKSEQSSDKSSSEILEKMEAYKKQIAKGYLSIDNPQRALKLALMLLNKKEQKAFYINLIRAYASKKLEPTLQIVQNLTDLDKKQKILKILALDQIPDEPEQSVKIANLIQNPSVKENLLISIFGQIINSDPLLALKLRDLIDNNDLKIKLLFNIARRLREENKNTDLIQVISLIINILLKSLVAGLDKSMYKVLKNALYVLAETDNPTSANKFIERIPIHEVKDKILKDLFDDFYMMVDEVQTKIESELVFSQYFILNTYVSGISNEIKNFSLSGGNISNNVLGNDFNFNTVFLSLFGFDFSTFPILDRLYNDLKYTLNKSIAYYTFPSKKNYNQEEIRTLTTSLKQFFKNFEIISGQVLIFNLDFIPYLGKPTVILSQESDLDNIIYSKIKKIGETINIIVDDSLFNGGKISEDLKQILPPNKCRISNLVLSYEFINDYDIFKTLIQSLL
ncbi:MAG: hypothetical protein ACFFDY_07185 [Candidatus Thorarchaeota archaeon]